MTKQRDFPSELRGMDAHDTPSFANVLMADAAEEIERLRGQLNFANREPPHCPSCNCGSPEPEKPL